MIPLGDNVKSRTFPFVNWLLILGNAYGFYREISQPDMETLALFIKAHALVPAALTAAPEKTWPTVFSAMFLHGGWLHLLGNMLYLWIFGDNVEDRLGHRRYLLFYLLCGLLASLAQVAMAPASPLPMLGASGAIAGVMGAYFLLYPRARITTVIPIFIFLKVVEIPAIFFLGFWFLIQAFQSWGAMGGTSPAGGVAWWAHAGGFLAGGLLVLFFKKGEKAGALRRSR